MHPYANRLAFALDRPRDLEDIRARAESFAGLVGTIKLNSAFVLHHERAVRAVKDFGLRIWTDLKFHDIPDTVADEIRALRRLGVDIATIHFSGGSKMIEAACKAATEPIEGLAPVFIHGITVLTSISQDQFNNELGMPGLIQDHVLRLARLGQANGASGVICSPLEVEAVLSECPDLEPGTPGIRFAESGSDDQARHATPGVAYKNGSRLLVMGREFLNGGPPAAIRALTEIQAVATHAAS